MLSPPWSTSRLPPAVGAGHLPPGLVNHCRQSPDQHWTHQALPPSPHKKKTETRRDHEFFLAWKGGGAPPTQGKRGAQGNHSWRLGLPKQKGAWCSAPHHPSLPADLPARLLTCPWQLSGRKKNQDKRETALGSIRASFLDKHKFPLCCMEGGHTISGKGSSINKRAWDNSSP